MKHNEMLVRPGSVVRLAEIDPGATYGFANKSEATDKLEQDIARLIALQDVFAAARSHALLIVLQGMDSAGKDGAIKHVMSGVNPQGIDVHGFKKPSDQEERHDYLWRCSRVLPESGRIGIFNRSYFEEVIVVRVHRELLAAEPAGHGVDVWSERFEDINAFERHLVRSGTLVVKFFLHLSKAEQRRRLLKRLDDESKNWKFSEDDIHERAYWDRYQSAYEKMLTHTSTDWAPWYVLPADHKWFVRAAVADVLVAQLEALDLRYPRIEGASRAMLDGIRAHLQNDGQ